MPPFYPSSKVLGLRDSKATLSLTKRTYRFPTYGHVEDRDINGPDPFGRNSYPAASTSVKSGLVVYEGDAFEVVR